MTTPTSGTLAPPIGRAPFAGEPDRDCPLCPRLAAFRQDARAAEPAWFNAPVPTFGDPAPRVLIVGLAPGLRGANRTGRPFTGDYAGDLLYETLLRTGFARGTYERRIDDGLRLVGCAVANAVRCVPPQNKPTPEEIRTCRGFFGALVARLEVLEIVVALGRVAHETVLRTFDHRLAGAPFAHGRRHELSVSGKTLTLYDSYHCSRYNTNTGVLTEPMFRRVFEDVRDRVAGGV